MNGRRILHRAGPAILAAGLCRTAAALAADPLPTITMAATADASAQVASAIAAARREASAR